MTTAGRIFQGFLRPPGTRLVGLAALVQALDVQAPVRRPACVSDGHVRGGRREEQGWRVFDRRYGGGDDLGSHLTFALRHEDIDLLVLKRVLSTMATADLGAYVRSSPTGQTQRRAWFLFEYLTGRHLDVPDAPRVTAVPVLDPRAYVTTPGIISSRHRVRNNLLGTAAFCPVVRRTPAIRDFAEADLGAAARATLDRVSQQLIARAASFLMLADSRASFQIEGERPPRNRLERWGRAVMQSGRRPLTLGEIEYLHSVLIEDTRFVTLGLRSDGVFLGERTASQDPLPEFIGARPQDLPGLVAGLIAAQGRLRDADVDPVIQAAVIAFGFVYIHPLQDGNGRLHRCLIHHVLAESGFTPPGLVFPVSAVMLDRIDTYRQTLQAHSAPLMPFIEWRPTASRNVEVLNDTADLYRYFDGTDAAEFLYQCVQRTVEVDVPRELAYLRAHDQAVRRISDLVEMPGALVEDLLMFIRQNGGTLPRRRRVKEFERLTDDEVRSLEIIVREAFSLVLDVSET